MGLSTSSSLVFLFCKYLLEISLCNETNQERDNGFTSKVFSRSGVRDTFIVAPDRINSSKSWLNGPSLCREVVSRLIALGSTSGHPHHLRRQIQQRNLVERPTLNGGECRKARTQIARRVRIPLLWLPPSEKVPCGYLVHLLGRFVCFPCRITSCYGRSCLLFFRFHP